MSTLTDPTACSDAQGTLCAEAIKSLAALEPHLNSWRVLAAGAPMRSPEWLLGWWGSFAEPGDSLHLILVLDTQRHLVGLAPLYRQKKGRTTTLRVLGARDHCSHHTDWLARPGWEVRAGERIALSLAEDRRNWQRLLFEVVDEDAIALRATMRYLRDCSILVHARQVNSCWKISLPDSWDDYLLSLSRSLRKRCRKLQRDFLDSGAIEVRQVEKVEDLPKGFDILRNLHAARWGTAKQPLGVFSDIRFSDFHQKVARSLLTQGQLRLAWLEQDGTPVAAEYQFFDQNRLYAYQAGLDVTTGASTGKLSMMAAIRFALDRKCRWFDLLGGDEPYKANWRAVPIPCHNWRAWPRSFRGFQESAFWHIYTSLAKSLKLLIPDHLVRRFLQIWTDIRRLSVPANSRAYETPTEQTQTPWGKDH